MKLTKAIISNAVYEGEERTSANGNTYWSRYVLWDDLIPGFGLRITPTGKKSFVLSYRAGTRKRLMTLGTYGVLTLAQARKRARLELAKVIDGDDPLAQRREVTKGEVVADLAKRYITEHAEVKKKPKSVQGDKQMLRDYVVPKLGRLKITEVTRRDVASLHHGLHEKPYAANRVLALLSKMFNLAEKWGLRPDGSNPCRHVEKFKEKKRERYLSQDEFRRLAGALVKAEETGSEDSYAIAAIRLLILTGCRLREILHLRWKDVDFEAGCLRLPDSKSGAKTVFLSEAACEVLTSIPRIQGNPWVIVGRMPNSHRSDLKGPWKNLRAEAELEDLRIHDLRHSFAAVGAGLGLSLPMIGKLLGHTQVRTTARYAHLATDPMHEAANRIGAKLSETLLKGNGAQGEAQPTEE